MTPEEIRELAKSLCATSNPTQDDVWLIEDIIEGILRTHCIVSKEKAAADLDFSVGEAKESESDQHISISKLRDILEDIASSQFEPRRLNDATIDEIINRVKESI